MVNKLTNKQEDHMIEVGLELYREKVEELARETEQGEEDTNGHTRI